MYSDARTNSRRLATKKRLNLSRLLLVLPTFLALLASAGMARAAIPAAERAVLQNLYAYTDGVDWDQKTNWNGPPGTECSWFGITCDASGTTVTAIDLAGNNLYGSLPSLSVLTNLESFDIHQTATGGIGGYNSLLGPIPPLSGLTKLRVFIANDTFFSGSIPPLTGLTSLQHFECTGCGLSGNIPSLSGLTNLEYFDVSGNQLTGSIPALAGLSQLAYFDVSGHLTGEIPDLSGLINLQTFFVGGDRLTGGIPDLIGLPKLKEFSVGGLLTGHIGSLSNLPSLTLFDVSYDLLTGSIPPLDGLPNLQQFSVNSNYLTGSIPDLSGLSSLQWLGIGQNQFSGPLPAPPQSLIAGANANANVNAYLCPNLLTPASDPPSSTDLDWNTVTYTTPWSKDCAPNPSWKTILGASSSLNPSSVGQPVTFTAVVYGMNPIGTVTFTAQSDAPGNTTILTLCDSVPLVGSVAACTTSNIPPTGSTYTIGAVYSGDANNAPASNFLFGTPSHLSTISQFVGYPPMNETATADAVQVGQPVDLTGTLDGGADTDTFTFDDGLVPLCSDVPVHLVNGLHIGHCVTRFELSQYSMLGPHSLTVGSDSHGPGAGSGSLPMIVNVVAATPFDADQFALTGSWYNPPTSGQGLEIEVYSDLNGAGNGFLFGGWFTYNASGNPQWMTLQGNLSSSHGASYALAIGKNTGGNFNAPPITQAVAIGSAALTFYDCTHAALVYQFADGRSGTIPYVRLTSSIACSSAVPAVPPVQPPANYNDVLHSGAWYNPATSGQGLIVDLVPAQTTFFAAWYTYAPQTEGLAGLAGQRWFTLQSNDYVPGNLILSKVPIIATSGGIFNTPTQVNNVQVGTADVTFTSCTSMTLKYTFSQGEFSGLSGTIDERIIGPAAGCR